MKASTTIARLRANMLDRARAYFASEDLLEVDTPALSQSAVSDPQIESVKAMMALDPDVPRYLHTSPEYFMKRLLCAGYPDIYQVCKVFRDSEVGRYHQPEFTMIEWYRLGFELRAIADDTLALIAKVLDDASLHANAVLLSYCDAFEKFANRNPLTAEVNDLATIINADESLRSSLGDEKSAWLDLVLEQVVVPNFESDKLTVLTHYPISQAALARQCPDNAQLADRFEVGRCQHELANGYVELTDADEYARRFAADQSTRKSRGQTGRPLDNEFLDAIRHGLPACAGVAVGFDRLLMIGAGVDDIRDVQAFSFAENK